MILIDIVYSKIEDEFELFEAIVDTGSTYCVIGKQTTDNLGMETKILQLWQMENTLIVPKAKIKLRYNGNGYDVGGLMVEIEESYKQPIAREEFCARPASPHPLTNRIVIGKSLLDKLSKEEYKELFL